MTVSRFEDLEIWKNARLLFKRVHQLTEETGLRKNYSLRDQILRSTGSVMDNISEGFERDGKKEFMNFLYIAKGSLGETRSQLYRCLDCGYISTETSDSMINDCCNLSAQIKHLITYLSKTELTGLKRK